MLNPPTDTLPPHDTNLEAMALGCVFLAAETGNMHEVDTLLGKLRPHLFFDLRNRAIHDELARMRMGDTPHAVCLPLFYSWIKGRENQFGGLVYLAGLPDQVPSLAMFDEVRRQLVALAQRRWALAESARLAERARGGDIDLKDIRSELTAALDKIDTAVTKEKPMIETWDIDDAMNYKEDESLYLLGKGMICRGEIAVIAGQAGVGKSRLANTLAFAGARGTGKWMGYDIRRRWRTLVLQTENNPARIKEEFACLDRSHKDRVRISLPLLMEFSNPAFRRELKRLWEGWQFDMLVVDNMNDVARADGREDFLEGIANIMASLPRHPETPAVIIIAHLTKGSTRALKPMTGARLLDELSGSNVLAAKARTVFTLQRVDSADTTDSRVVFDCAKANNDMANEMSCWYRANGEFKACKDWDKEAWLNPPEEGAKIGRKELTREKWLGIFGNGLEGMKRTVLVKRLMSDFRASQSAAYNWITAGVESGILIEAAGIVGMRR